MINYRFLTTETDLKALYIFYFLLNAFRLKNIYIFQCFLTTSSVKLLLVTTVQIFVYKVFFSNCVFRKKEKDTRKTFHNLKMKTCFEEEPHFENESSFQNPS